MLYQLLFLYCSLTATLSVPVPSTNVAGSPNTLCSIQDTIPMGRLKSISCLLQSVVMEPMKDPSIPSFDYYRPENINDIESFYNNLETCDCLFPLWDSGEFSSTVKYNVDTHVTIRNFYDPRIVDPEHVPVHHRQYLPEDLTSNGVSTPLNTQWILKDHINSLKGFVDYYTPPKNITGGDKLAAIAEAVNFILSTYVNFQFSPNCPSDPRSANFVGLANSDCEFKCANWHFNHTINGFYYALGNEAIYPPPSNPTSPNDPYPERDAWLGTNCCDSEPLETISPEERKNLTCSLQMLSSKAFQAFHEISQPTTNCPSSIPTVTGISTWESYLQTGLFPLYSFPNTSSLYIYSIHFSALEKHHSDLMALSETITQGTWQCYSQELQSSINTLIDTIQYLLPLSDKWLHNHNCPYCSTCKNSTAVHPNSVPINTALDCLSSYEEVSCLLVDLKKVSESAWMYLSMRPGAVPALNSCF